MTMSNHSSTNTGTIISELLFTGRRFNADPDQTKYVCHTSSIPLCTTVDNQLLLKQWSDTVELTHSIKYQPGYEAGIDYRCCRKHCMFVGANTEERELLRSSCPCSKVSRIECLSDGEEVEVFLQPLCFIQILKETRYRFGYRDASSCDSSDNCCHNDGRRYGGDFSNRPKIDLSEVMFCQDGIAITDSSYPKILREELGFSGWSYANTAEKLGRALDQLYWYRKFVRDNTRTFLAARCSEYGAKHFRQTLEQCLFTVNGAITKKLLLFPCEMESYRKLAELTACLFEELVRDYFRKSSDDIKTDEKSLFARMKRDYQEVKSLFPSDMREIRLSALNLFEGRKDAHAKFWKLAFNRLRNRIEGLDEDYSNSPAFIYTMSGFSQTRNMGYLPQWVAEIKRRAFRQTIGRPREEISRSDMSLIANMVIKQSKDAGLEPYFLKTLGQAAKDDFREVISQIEIPLKPSASITQTVSSGGKVEDARQLFADACENRWKIPIRSLEDGSIEDYIYMTPELRKTKPGYQGYLFWISLQLVINSHHENEPSLYKEEYMPLPNSAHWLKTMYEMTIVHISEPGKERNLTKTSAILAWILTPASKVSQGVLSFAQDHRAGLILSAQDWMHQRRISAESYESEWMYDQNTRKRYDVWNGFQDWTQSTDFIPRRVGAVALRAWFGYIGFPSWYAKMVIWTTQRNYVVQEVLQSNFNGEQLDPVLYQGFVNEGWMMSMPLTKTVLHLMHDVNVGLVETILKKHGCRVSDRPVTKRVDIERDKLGPFYISPARDDQGCT